RAGGPEFSLFHESRTRPSVRGILFRMLSRLYVGIVLGVLAASTISAQHATRHVTRVVDPVELSGPPKKPPVVSEGLRSLAQTSVLKDIGSKDPAVLTKVAQRISSL